MREFRGSLAGVPWVGYMPDRPQDLKAFVDQVAQWARNRTPVAVDSEGKGLNILGGDPDYLRLIQFGDERTAWVIPVEAGSAFRAAALDALKTLPNLSGHNAQSFDLPAFHVYGGLDYQELCRKTVDTMLLAKLVDPRAVYEGGIGAKLKELSDHFIDPTAADTQDDLEVVFRGLKIGHTKSNGLGWSAIDLYHPTYCEYAALDVILTSRLRTVLESTLRKLSVPQKLISYEHELARICGVMQIKGMVLDAPYTEGLQVDLSADAERWSTVAARYGVVKIGSSRQVADALIGMGETLTERTANGAYKADGAVLHALADMDLKSKKRLGVRTPNPLAEAIIYAKRSAKWGTAYAGRFLEHADINGRIHPSIRTLAARTGRMSVTNPAVQTLPAGDWKIRRALLAEEGHVFVSTDFASVEMRVLAALADVSQMKEAVRAGRDLNDFTASLIYGPDFTYEQRNVCKGVGYGTIYGGGATGISRMTGAPESLVREAQAKYHRVYPEIKRTSRRWQREALETGMTTVSVTGRRLPLDRNRTYAVVNYQVQSAARDCLGQALIHMEERGLLEYLRLPIHDEVLASAPEAQAEEIGKEIGECMTFDLYGVPVEAEPEVGGRSWGSLYMKKGKKLDAELAIAQDPFYATNPEVAHARAA